MMMRAGVVVAVLVLLAQVAAADIVIDKIGVHIEEYKPTGGAWDTGLQGKPDPQIAIYIDGDKVQVCPAQSDTFDVDCSYGVHALAAGSVIELQVEDVDLVKNDVIGRAVVELADQPGRQTLVVDGGIERAWIEGHHVDGPGFWGTIAVKLGARGIGAAIGVAIALVLYKLLGSKLLTPRRREPAVLTQAAGKGDKIGFWRSPILLASAGASIVCSVLAIAMRGPHVALAVASIPYVLGGFAVTAPIIDAHAHEQLGNKRLRLIIAALAAMFAVPLFDFVGDLGTGLGFLARHMGWTLLVITLLALL